MYWPILPAIAVIVEFERGVQSVPEDVGSVAVCAVLQGDTAGEDVYVTLTTRDGTATGIPKVAEL